MMRALAIPFIYLTSFFAYSTGYSQWEKLDFPVTGDVRSFAVLGDNIFASSGSALYTSTDKGISWIGLDSSKAANSLAVLGNCIFEASEYGVYRSPDTGKTWTLANTGLNAPFIYSLAVLGSYLFAGTNIGVFLSTDNGASWNAVDTGLKIDHVHAFAVSGSNIFAGTESNGIYLSSNNGASWASAGKMTGNYITALCFSDQYLFAASRSQGISVTTDNGFTWTKADSGLTQSDVRSFAVSDSNLFAGTRNDGIFLSTNSGMSWRAINSGLDKPPTIGVFSIFVTNDYIFIGVAAGQLYRRPLADATSRVKSKDDLKHNPNVYVTEENIHLTNIDESIDKITICSATGQVVKEIKNQSSSLILSKRDLSSGFYEVVFSSKGVITAASKIILER